MTLAKPKFSDYSLLRKVRRRRSRSLISLSFLFLFGVVQALVWAGLSPANDLFLHGRLTSISIERELTRKQYLRSLENRTPEQIAEEEALYLELKRLEQTERQFKKDRDDLLRTLLGIESGLSDIQLGDDSTLHGLSSMPEIKKSKRRTGGGVEVESPSTPSSSILQQRRMSIVKDGTLAPPLTDLVAHISTRRKTLYHTYRSTSNYSNEIFPPGSRHSVVQDPNPKTSDGLKSRFNALCRV